jgi:hypothetical protein
VAGGELQSVAGTHGEPDHDSPVDRQGIQDGEGVGDVLLVGIGLGVVGPVGRPFPQPSTRTTRKERARCGTWSFHCRAWTMAHDVSSAIVRRPAPWTS